MSAPVIVSVRPTRRRLAQLAVGLAVLGGAIAILATARAARVEPDARPSPLASTAYDDAERHGEDAAWTIAAEPVERVGYRRGRRHVFDVVPLGPTAVEVEVGTARAFLAMRAAAADAGVELRLESGFRTAEQQRALFRAWRKGHGNKAARPGMSNHQSGRALDIAVVSVPEALAWLEANAASFGFKRTVKTEPWHWEHVESPVARGATKRVSRKALEAAKVRAGTKRPARRPSSIASSRHPSGGRVTASRR